MISVRDAELAKTIGRNITKRLIEKDKTQQDMCNDLGWKKGTVSAWVNGTRMPKMDKIDIMCKYFGCERDDLLFDAREMKMMRSVSIPVQGEKHPDGYLTKEEVKKRLKDLSLEDASLEQKRMLCNDLIEKIVLGREKGDITIYWRF